MEYQACRLRAGAAALAAVALPASADGLSASVGFDYSTGKYGASTTTEIWFVPVIGKYETGPLTLKATIPWVKISDAGNVGPDGEPIVASCGSTESGLGDITASAGYALLDGSRGGVLLDVVGKVKFPTADEDRCLGTGKTDYALQVDLAKGFGSVTGFGTLGWRRFGDPSGRNFRDPWYATLGGAFKLAPPTSLGLAYDWREKVSARGDGIREATLFLNQRFGEHWGTQFYLIKGFSDASPDWGGGLLLNHRY